MADFQFVKVEPDQLTLAWDAVREGLEHLKRKTKSAKWRPEDIYTAIKERVAELYIPYLDGEYGGFVILAETPEAFTLEKRLLVWCAYMARVQGPKGRSVTHPRAVEIQHLTDEAIDGVGRTRGIKKAFFVSSRKGWNKIAGKDRWSVYEVTYQREIN